MVMKNLLFSKYRVMFLMLKCLMLILEKTKRSNFNRNFCLSMLKQENIEPKRVFLKNTVFWKIIILKNITSIIRI